MGFAPTADWALLYKAAQVAAEMEIELKTGNILSSDTFYDDDPESWKLWTGYGVLAVEMEAAALYTLAARFGVKALCLLTVSDSIVTREETTSEEREKTFTRMMEIALETAVSVQG
jgi:purine-nucleoside phosphorylase